MKYLIALAVMLIAFGYVITNTREVTASQIVYDVCNQARQEINGTSERICGELQYKYDIEFLCQARNMSPGNHCWTEVNHELKEDQE